MHKKYSEGLTFLHKIFSQGTANIPAIKVIEPYHRSVFHISHKVFEKYGLDEMEKMEDLASFRNEITEIRRKSNLYKDKFKGTIVCSCCGSVQETTVPVEVLNYKLLLEYSELSRNVGFILFEDIKREYYHSLGEKFSYIIKNLNPSASSKLLILVEGASEEVGLPILAFKRRIMLAERSIMVYNSQSKEQVLRDFKAFKNKYKDIKMFVLHDSDAKKEKAELERVINKHKYDLCYLEKGTWEDLFPLDKSIQILNELYTEGDEILQTDFDVEKEFTKQVGKILYEKEKPTFDKGAFSEKICWGLDSSEIPNQITILFDLAEKLHPSEIGIFRNYDEN